MYKAFMVYIIIMNIAGVMMMRIDKERARQGKWRISEKTLFLTAILGGSLGCWMGMYLYRHKTKHWYFVAGLPFILVVQIAAALILPGILK